MTAEPDTGTPPWPTDIRVRGNGTSVEIDFDTGEQITLSASALRAASPSSEMRGHRTGQSGSVPDEIGQPDAFPNARITGAENTGNYAIRLVFSDGHATGIYTWAYLLKLGRHYGGGAAA